MSFSNNFKNETYIHPTSEINAEAVVGKGSKIWNLVQLRKHCVIGDGCTLGKGVYIDYGVKIGNHVKIQNGVSIYQGVTVEDNVFIGPHAVFTNDLYPRATSEDWKIVPTLIQKGASIGAGSVILCGVTIASYAMTGAGSVVIRDVPKHGLVVGNPARLIGFVCYCGRRADFREEKGEVIILQCQKCKETIMIPTTLYQETFASKS